MNGSITVALRAGLFTFALGLLGIPTANAVTVTWDFGPLAPGALGTTQAYTQDGFTLTASGFSNTVALGAGTPNVGLFGKTGAGDESGLGLQNDVFSENEISGASLVHIAMPAGASNVTFQMDSVTTAPLFGTPEAWEVWGSNSATSLGTVLLTGSDELTTHPLADFAFYTFAADGFSASNGNVLLASITANVPLPPAIFLFGTALAGLGFLSRRRKKGSALQAV